MTKYYNPTLQTKFGEEGNCLAACIATLYPVSIDEVPFYLDTDDDWIFSLSEWLGRKLDKYLITVRLQDECHLNLFNGSLVIASVKSPNPAVERHAVITCRNKIVFDPMIGECCYAIDLVQDDPVFVLVSDVI